MDATLAMAALHPIDASVALYCYLIGMFPRLCLLVLMLLHFSNAIVLFK